MFASELAVRRLEVLLGATPSPTHAEHILDVCPPQEEHTFSPLLLTLLLRGGAGEVGSGCKIHRSEELAAHKPFTTTLQAASWPLANRPYRSLQ